MSMTSGLSSSSVRARSKPARCGRPAGRIIALWTHAMTEPLLELIAISKAYPGVMALSHVSLRVDRGEVLALIGENGAGKSTLMKVLGGVVSPSAGSIRIGDRERAGLTVGDAIA